MNPTKNIYTVEFKNVHYYLEIHTALKNGLKLPEYYSKTSTPYGIV